MVSNTTLLGIENMLHLNMTVFRTFGSYVQQQPAALAIDEFLFEEEEHVQSFLSHSSPCLCFTL